MNRQIELTCDGCGQMADAEHFARRLRRLEWATRFRPVHIQALILGGIASRTDAEFLYAPETRFQGEAGNILRGARVSVEGKSHEVVLTEFQKLGLMLTHVLECPLNEGCSGSQGRTIMEKQWAAVTARIRRSLKPKQVVLISGELGEMAETVRRTDLGCPVWPAEGGAFFSSGSVREAEVRAFQAAVR
jgi:hypothetical protein